VSGTGSSYVSGLNAATGAFTYTPANRAASYSVTLTVNAAYTNGMTQPSGSITYSFTEAGQFGSFTVQNLAGQSTVFKVPTAVRYFQVGRIGSNSLMDVFLGGGVGDGYVYIQSATNGVRLAVGHNKNQWITYTGGIVTMSTTQNNGHDIWEIMSSGSTYYFRNVNYLNGTYFMTGGENGTVSLVQYNPFVTGYVISPPALVLAAAYGTTWTTFTTNGFSVSAPTVSNKTDGSTISFAVSGTGSSYVSGLNTATGAFTYTAANRGASYSVILTASVIYTNGMIQSSVSITYSFTEVSPSASLTVQNFAGTSKVFKVPTAVRYFQVGRIGTNSLMAVYLGGLSGDGYVYIQSATNGVRLAVGHSQDQWITYTGGIVTMSTTQNNGHDIWEILSSGSTYYFRNVNYLDGTYFMTGGENGIVSLVQYSASVTGYVIV
jgi:hypothetical protein